MTSTALFPNSQILASLHSAYTYELSCELTSAENQYITLLDTLSKSHSPSPLTLIHYLDFVRRTRGLDEALYLYEDLLAAESDLILKSVNCQWALKFPVLLYFFD